ncbi:MAG: ROK family protein [Treponema sp.]|nr:ROK family protein [Treponema sp.]
MNKHASRAVISSELLISLPSVVRIVDNLLERGFLRFSGEMENSGGRKRPLIELNYEQNIFMGVMLSANAINACIFDFSGNLIRSESFPFFADNLDRSLNVLYTVVEDLLATVKTYGGFFRGISVSVPGTVKHATGEVILAPSINWRDVPLKVLLKEHFDTAIIVENDATLAILAELWHGFGKQCFNLVLLEIGMGLGGGIIIDGVIYRGATDTAGEIGHIVFENKKFSSVQAMFGPAEMDIAGIGLAQKVRREKRAGLKGTENDIELVKKLFGAFYAGEEWTYPIIETFVDSLAMAVIAVDAIINPEIIVLRGVVADLARGLIVKIKDRIGAGIKLEISQVENFAEMLGGAVNLIYEALDYCCFRSMR